MVILFKINKTEMINYVISKTLLLSIIKQWIILLSIHRFYFFFFYSQKRLSIMEMISSSWRTNELNFEWKVKIDTLKLKLDWQDI